MSDQAQGNPDSSPEKRKVGEARSTQPTDDAPTPNEAAVDSLDAEPERISIHGEAMSSEGDTRPRVYPIADSEYVYKMDYPNRGMFIVINNKTFDSSTKRGARKGSDTDAANLYTQFKKLGFEVKLYNDLSCDKMLKVIIGASKLDHSQSDMFAMAILSHGDEGIVYGTDGGISLDRLFAPIKGDKCSTLVGKPKFFILQSCRGSELDHGVERTDAEDPEEEEVYRVPVEADFLFTYSTTPGHFSWSHSKKGSWFIQTLTKVLQEYGHTREIMWILTRTNYMVATEFESKSAQEFTDKKKQIPSIVSQLTKELYLTHKSK